MSILPFLVALVVLVTTCATEKTNPVFTENL